MGMNQQNLDLFDAVNAGVKWLWKSKLNAEIDEEIRHQQPGLSGAARATNPRIGVDRDADGNVIGPGAHPTKDFSSLF